MNIERVQRIPRGVRLGDERREGLLSDIPVRCGKQAPSERPKYVRSRFAWDIREVSGALGDLGTFLPHIIGAITIVGLAPVGILTAFGLFYILSAVFYGLPIAIQPMKAASAVMLVSPMGPGAVAGAGIVIGLFFLIVGATGTINRITRLIPPSVASGLQLGLGLSLTLLGIKMFDQQPWLGLGTCAVIVIFLTSKRFPAAIVALVLGIIVGQLTGSVPSVEHLKIGFNLPSLVIPSWAEILQGTKNVVLPQLPLTLTNAIIVTAAVSQQLFAKEVHRVNERNLSLTTGIGNLLGAPFGAYPMCHGAGGLTAHHRFGARTGTAPLIIGFIFLCGGVLFGDSVLVLMQSIPTAVLGALLFFSGVDLAKSSKPQQYNNPEFRVVLMIALLTVTVNPAVAFAVGLPIANFFHKSM